LHIPSALSLVHVQKSLASSRTASGLESVGLSLCCLSPASCHLPVSYPPAMATAPL